MDSADDIELMVIELHQQTIDLLSRLEAERICRATASQEAAAARNQFIHFPAKVLYEVIYLESSFG